MKRTDLTTRQAADLVGVPEASFHVWASRRGLVCHRKIRLGRATVNLWDADAVFDAQCTRPSYGPRQTPGASS